MQNAKRYSIIVGVVVLVLLIIGIVLAAIFNAWLDILYISLIIVATFTLVVHAFQIYTVLLLIRTITTVRDELKPLLASVQETLGIVRETAKTAGHSATTIGSTAQLTSELALGPSVRAASAVVAGRQMLGVFLGKGHAASRAEQRRKQQMEAITGGE
jgi:hypothetical protein